MKWLVWLGFAKSVLQNIEINVLFHDGDKLDIVFSWKGNVVFTKTIDFMPGV